jgi:hypothetical protein
MLIAFFGFGLEKQLRNIQRADSYGTSEFTVLESKIATLLIRMCHQAIFQ